MATDKRTRTVPSASPDTASGEDLGVKWNRVVRRRAVLMGMGAAGAALPAGVLLGGSALAKDSDISRGDVAILRFLAAAEIIETDLWVQYAELGGVNGGNAAYKAALENLDEDMPQYISDNTDDEQSHADFLNAYLRSKGAQPVSLDAFRTLPSTKATGARQIGRLTTLQSLNVDTSWWTRYRSTENPDLGATFPQALTIRNQPAIPVSDQDTPPTQEQPNPPQTTAQKRMQAIANTAGFHFPFIEVGGSSLYTTMSLKASSLEVLRIVVSIGGTEVNHFAIWHDKAGNAPDVTDPETGTVFNVSTFDGNEALQANLIMPEPCDFLSERLPECSVIRPSTVQNSGAVAAVRALTQDGLFKGQSQRFFDTLEQLAVAADAARRET
jgi:hypothetical protein